MLVCLVPLFLAANISEADQDWKYGAEAIYDGKIEGWTPPIDASGRSLIFNTTIKMMCRTDAGNFLACHFDEPRIVVTLLETSGESRIIVNSTNKFVDDNDPQNRFELYLSRNETEPKLIMPIDMQGSKSSIVILLANQLVTNLTPPAQSAMEDYSTFGNCKLTETNYQLETVSVKEDDRPYEIVITPDSQGPNSKVLGEIKKTRDVESCYIKYQAFKGIDMKLTSSKTHTIITEGGFTSFTENEMIFKDTDHPNKTGGIARERITLSLNRIVPACGPLSKMEFPFTWTKLLSFGVFHSSSFVDLITKPLDQYEFWLQAAGRKQ